MKKLLKSKLTGIEGQGMSEYLILTLLIAVASITVTKTVGRSIFTKLKEVHNELQTVTVGSVRDGG